jgi:predicted aspartyl protease
MTGGPISPMRHQWAAALAAVSLLTAAAPAKSQVHEDCVVPLHEQTISRGLSGLSYYWASVTLSSAAAPSGVSLEGMIDTGFAGYLSFPRPLANRLRANNVINERDRYKITSLLADGSEAESDVVHAAGWLSFTGCTGVTFLSPIIVTGDQAFPLIGQGLLSWYASAAIDRENLTLVLKGYPVGPPCTPATCRLDPNAKPYFLGKTPR